MNNDKKPGVVDMGKLEPLCRRLCLNTVEAMSGLNAAEILVVLTAIVTFSASYIPLHDQFILSFIDLLQNAGVETLKDKHEWFKDEES